MPWRETCVMDQRIAFVAACLRDEAPMSVPCAAIGISRKTCYQWQGRYRAEGPEGLLERPRAPHRYGRRMAPELAVAILALRRDRPYWGPRKRRAILQRRQPEMAWPASRSASRLPSTAHGWSATPRRPRHHRPQAPPPDPLGGGPPGPPPSGDPKNTVTHVTGPQWYP